MGWESQFRERMRSFEAMRATRDEGVAASLKVRVTSGCFHREHSPHAYALIDEQLAAMPRERWEFDLVEHESGPELLVLLAVATAGLGLAKSVIDLLVAILEARREGVKQGDHPSDPIELIIRRMGDGDTFREETVLRIGHREPVDRSEIEALLDAAIERVADDVSNEER